MKKIWVFILIILAGSTLSHAQRGEGFARIHAAKMAYISDRLRLSSSQASNFTPLYNEYEMEVRTTRQGFFAKYKGTRPDEADDATSRQWIDDNLDYQQQIIELKRKYNERFLKVISPQQLSDLYKSEREFNQMLMQRLKQQRNGAGRFNRMNR